jgi:hypothetical protein
MQERILMKTFCHVAALAISLGLASNVSAQSTPSAPPPLPESKVQNVLDRSAKDARFTFIVFTKGDSPAYRTMLDTVKSGVSARPENTTFTTADANAAGEQSLVEKLGIARAPMPLTVAIAPNGAVTGIFAKTVKSENLSASIVPPTMMRCMKLLQDQKLVFVCLTHEKSESAPAPMGVQMLSVDPQFKNRVELVSMFVDDPAEARFIDQMRVKPADISAPTAVLIAPPGVLVGHYGVKSTREEIAAAIHKAGQCCDDPNCKHSHSAPTTPPAKTTTSRSK